MTQYFFDSPGRVKGVIVFLMVLCAGLFIGDLFVPKDHLHYAVEGYFGFYCVYGFIACVLLVFVSRYILRPLVMKKEDFYD